MDTAAVILLPLVRRVDLGCIDTERGNRREQRRELCRVIEFQFHRTSLTERTNSPLQAVSAMNMVDQLIRSKGREYCQALLECLGRQHQRDLTERIRKHRQQTGVGLFNHHRATF
jgi:hypothetical protein